MGTLSKIILLTTAIFAVSSFEALPAKAELRAFRLKITDTTNGTEREVITRFDHEQYPMYNFLKRTEVAAIVQTWMCYDRSDYKGQLCPPPAESPDTQGRSPASAK